MNHNLSGNSDKQKITKHPPAHHPLPDKGGGPVHLIVSSDRLSIQGWENPDRDMYFRKKQLPVAVDNAISLQKQLFDMM